MIFVRLTGGLGNQLFQYAAGRALALRRGTELRLDCRLLDGRENHNLFALDRFQIAKAAGKARLPPRRDQVAPYALWRAGLWPGPRPLRESRPFPDPRVLSAPDGVYLEGYFHSEAYFADQTAVLRRDLSHCTAPSGQTAQMLQTIAADRQAVSVHVRRGDYLLLQKYVICDADYYAQALAAIAGRTGIVPRAYVFSDDPDWASQKLDLGVEKIVIRHNGAAAAEDLRLMSACRHHVIANSTFSWWGAWLNTDPAKVVVAPKVWFAKDDARPELCPPEWVRL